jgi:hypothetical protein
MASLADVQEKAAELSTEERESLIAYLVHSLPDAPLGPDDDEVKRREEELESGAVKGLSHEEFLKQVGRR